MFIEKPKKRSSPKKAKLVSVGCQTVVEHSTAAVAACQTEQHITNRACQTEQIGQIGTNRAIESTSNSDSIRLQLIENQMVTFIYPEIIRLRNLLSNV